MLPTYFLELALTVLSFGAVNAESSRLQVRSGYKVKERVSVPRGWKAYEGRIDKQKSIDLKIGLVQQNLRAAENALYRVSNPKHAEYGRHMSLREAKKLIAPSQKSIDNVFEWLRSFGISAKDIRLNGDFVNVRVPISQAEEMLDTVYNGYHQKGKKVVRALSYSLPFHLHDHIDLIQPTTLFGAMHAHSSGSIRVDDRIYEQVNRLPAYPRALAVYNVTPSSLRTLYNIGNYSVVNSSTSIAIASYLEEYANFADYQNFTSRYVPSIPANASLFNVTSIAGGLNSQNLSLAGGEANLDVQYAFGLAAGNAQQTVFTTAGSPPVIDDAVLNGTNTNEPYLDFLNYILADNYTSNNTLPQVISTSYGDDEQSVPESYARRVCTGFMTLGLLGTSVIFSSGDTGVGPGGNVTAVECIGNQPGTPNYNKTIFLPAFPASCPYVTTVGGTTRQAPEVAVEILDRSNSTAAGFFSGGGFSNYFARPAYQEAAVSNYLPLIPANYTASGYFNASGRGYPDVAFQSWRFMLYLGGNLTNEGGTSAAAPGFSAIVALLNDARSTSGLPALGFLNPLLYALQNATSVNTTSVASNTSSIISSARASATARAGLSKVNGSTPFNDVTIGYNPGCGTNGFAAAPGWDPVTGLGSPNFAALLNATGGTI